MSRFLKIVDDDDDGDNRLVRAKPIDPKLARKLGSYGAGKDFVISTTKTEDEAREIGMHYDSLLPKSSTLSAQTLDGKALLEMRNKIGAKILKARLQKKTHLADKLQKQLNDLESAGEFEQCTSGGDKILYQVKRSGLVVPAELRKVNANKKGASGLVIDSIYKSDKSLSEMVAEEKRNAQSTDSELFKASNVAIRNRTHDDWVVDDAMMSVKRKRKNEEKEETSDRQKIIRENEKNDQTLDSCCFCLQSPRFRKQCLVAAGENMYLSSVPWRPLIDEHYLLVPIVHYSSTTAMDENVFEELGRWKRSLVEMWRSQEMDCIFIETAKDVQHRKHMFIECFGLPSEIGELAPIYFKKAIDESESDWTDNRKLIDLAKGGGNVRKAIPQGFSYFSVDFGLQPGFGHVIENEALFPRNFAHEVIGGMLDVDRRRWRMDETLTSEQQSKNTIKLKRQFTKFDWTEKETKRNYLDESK